jgi:hypothetical protein
MTFTYNTKCIIQGAVLVGLWWAASNDKIDKPKWWTALAVFWLFYVMNARLDTVYGCEHGSIYK